MNATGNDDKNSIIGTPDHPILIIEGGVGENIISEKSKKTNLADDDAHRNDKKMKQNKDCRRATRKS